MSELLVNEKTEKFKILATSLWINLTALHFIAFYLINNCRQTEVRMTVEETRDTYDFVWIQLVTYVCELLQVLLAKYCQIEL